MNLQSIRSEPKQPLRNWISWVTCRLSIRQKIACGYTLALGIVVLGTTAGFAIGDRYQQQARAQEADALEEMRDLHRLETSLLLTHSHQQHLVDLEQDRERLQKDYVHVLHHMAEASQIWFQVKSSYQNQKNAQVEESPAELEAFDRLLQNHGIFLDEYFRQTEGLVKQRDLSNLKPEEIEAGRKLLMKFSNSDWSLKLENLTDDLNELIHLINEEYEQAREKGVAAGQMRERIIAASIVLSVMSGILLAIYISHAISLPIQVTTKVAQQVTREENLDLQAPVLTKDEVGTLTIALNQLIQRVKQLLEEQQAANQTQLIHSEKMSSLGQMIAGVAHEINNPITLIYGNSIHACDYIEDLLGLLETYATEIPDPPQAVRSYAEEIDLAFLKQDLPELLESMKFGAERAAQIVLSLKDFSRLDEAKAHPVDLHACIDSTLLILNSRIKKQISVIRNYGNIPAIEGYTDLLYQVFMNLLINAIDALEESNGNKQIEIATELQDNGWVVVKIADNGSGISPEILEKIFNAFFTTKPRGIGTGLGLALSHQIIVEKHGGKLLCHSEVGVGTEFAIALPLKHEPLVVSSNKNFLLSTSA